MADVRLTRQQKDVVENRGGTLLVSAAAGSGKTKVLVERVLRRILEDGNSIDQFLIITFTSAAAAELRSKISDAITEALAGDPGNAHLSRQLRLLHLSQISTVHAFCGALIRQYGYILDIPADQRLMDDSEREELLARQLDLVLEDAYAEKDPDFLLLTDTLGGGRDDEALADLVKSVYEQLLSLPDPKRWIHSQDYRLDGDVGASPWGKLLLASARQQLQWLIQRYAWAVETMEGDELLEKQYLPLYRTHLSQLRAMLPVLDGPWDAIAGALTLEERRVAVRGYEDKPRLEAIQAVKKEGKKQLEAIRALFSRPEETLREEQNALASALKALLTLAERLDRRFSAEKRRKNRMDFSDQEHLAIRLLLKEDGTPTEVARQVSAQFVEIMVDEYQDSNRVQEAIFTAISAAGDSNRFLVGDVKQSIYGFRQAEPEMFLEKHRTYRPANEARDPEPRRLFLSSNFRSRPEILEAVNHTFGTVMSGAVGGMEYGPEERLVPGLPAYPEAPGPHVELHVLELQDLPQEQEETKYQREAKWVAGRILAMLQAKTLIRDGNDLRPVRPEDMAVLLRTRDPISVYAKAFKAAGIPVASEGGEDLFETPEVTVLVNLLRVISNPHQDVPLLAVLCSPLFRFSNTRLAAIRAGSDKKRFYDAMRDCREDWCQATVRYLESLRNRAGTESADRLVWALLHETSLLSAYSAMEGGQARRENLLAVYQLALSGASGGFLYVYQLLRILDRAAKSGTMVSAGSGRGVVLTTMHRSKGLEYPVVFLADLSRRFNHRDLTGSVLFDRELGLAAKITDPALRVRYPGLCYEALRRKKREELRSEELRILYVAMTRPKDYLIMTYAGDRTDSALTRLRTGAGLPAMAWAAASANCLGDWVLLSALNRMEAGALFRVCGRPECELHISQYPWEITYEKVENQTIASGISAAPEAQTAPAPPDPSAFLKTLTWEDPHKAATLVPSKVTATQLKGREKDTEAAEGAGVSARLPQLRRPGFLREAKGLTPTERGTAVHLFLQYASFSECRSEDGVEKEKLRLLDGAFMTETQLEAVKPETIVRLFRSELGQRMLSAEELIREYKFSLREDAGKYYDGVEGEGLLLQGVVDAAWREPDGLRVVDFKSDRVTEATVMERAETYRGQLTAYRDALERIFGVPVQEMYLYFLAIGKEVKL